MDDAVRTAIKCFQENLRDFGNPTLQPEKYNHYNGLSNLAEAVAVLQTQVVAMRQEILQLRSELARIKK